MNLEKFRGKLGQTDNLIKWIIGIALLTAAGLAFRNIIRNYS